MIRFASCTTAAALLSFPALAADVPIYNPAPAPMVSPTPIAYNWTGFYIGAHGGFGWPDILESDDDDGGAVIGGQLGVNWQFGGFVVGVEGDGSWVDFGPVDNMESIRLRGGFAIDRLLIYATGGAAFEDFDDLGWVAGGGLEFALTPNLSAGVEYLHYEFDEDEADVIRGRLNLRFGALAGY
jgi:outer membrane immunogenic protein